MPATSRTSRRWSWVPFERWIHATRDPAAARYWQQRPLPALWPLLLAIALLFSILPLIGDITALGTVRLTTLVANVAIVAAFTVGIFWAAIRQRFGMLLLIVVLFLTAMVLLDTTTPIRRPVAVDAAVRARLRSDALLIAGAVAASYALFITFLFRESGVLARLRGEVEVAALIHARLVPPVDARLGAWRAYGRSSASSEMGGDLLDVLPGPPDAPERWTAYVADVSGHGVGAGLFMGVVKTALRMALRQHASVPEALALANAELHAQKRRDMFATLVLVRGAHDGAVEVCTAGHLPVLHRAAITGRVTQVGQHQLPLGALARQSFRTGPLTCAPGDVLLLLSDGLPEVFDRSRTELGLDALIHQLSLHGALPLAELHDRLTALARAHGPIRDDETLLLLRREA